MNSTNLPPLYSLTAIGVATFLGSPLAGGYMLAKNYSALGQRQMGIYAIVGSIVLILVGGLITSQLAVTLNSLLVISFSQLFIVLLLTNKLQGPMFKSYESMGGKYYPMSRAVVVAIAASVLLIVVAALLFGTAAPPPVES